MAQRRPSRPKGAVRPVKPRKTVDPMRTALDRSTAQKLRTDRTLSFESQTSRANFWARQQKQLFAQEQAQMDQSVAQISQGTLKSQSLFQSANVSQATLQNAAPSTQGGLTVAGMTEAGIAPPPPPSGLAH
jgi:hypothetical protein